MFLVRFMDKVNLKNMESGELYEYADGKYVWKILRAGGTRGGNYVTSMSDVSIYTEVFRTENDGSLSCGWSGRLNTNPGLYDENGLDEQSCFSIFSYDEDCSAYFKQEKELVKASIELQKQVLEQEKDIITMLEEKIAQKSMAK